MTERLDPKDFSKQLYAQWRQHPMTVLVHQFLDDYAKQMKADAMERWQGGDFDVKVENFARGIVQALEQASNVEWAAIMKMYHPSHEEKEEQDDGKPPTE